VKSSYLKEVLINEYQDTWIQREKGDEQCVHGGGDYIDAAMSSLSISDE